jgi:hypothetical protein
LRITTRTLIDRVAVCVVLLMASCSSGDTGQNRVYAPCDGEPGSCPLATLMGGTGIEGCLCVLYCTSNASCPQPTTGTAVAQFQPLDYTVDGHSATCALPCDASTVCPDGMFCSGGGCWAAIREN